MMYIDYPIDSMQVGVVQLRYNDKADHKVSSQSPQQATFDSNFETIVITGYDAAWGHSLNVTKKAYQQTLRLNADIRYWPAFGHDDYQSSGAYIFRVANGTNTSVRYSSFQGMRVW